MANYIATARTNYFRVKDREEFEAWLETVGYNELSIIETDDAQRVGLNATHGDCAGWSTSWQDEEGDEHDLLEELASHLADGEVAILVEAGAENARYVTGFAIAVQPDPTAPEGYRKLEISIADIYGMVQNAWNVTPSEALY